MKYDHIETAESAGSKAKKVLYTAKVKTTGGRGRGFSRSDDGRLNIQHSPPGSSAPGTNPEQLFAAGWSTCFESAIESEALSRKIILSPEMAIAAEIDLMEGEDGYSLRARLNVSIPDLDRQMVQDLAHAAELICPYSKAIRDNVEVTISVV